MMSEAVVRECVYVFKPLFLILCANHVANAAAFCIIYPHSSTTTNCCRRCQEGSSETAHLATQTFFINFSLLVSVSLEDKGLSLPLPPTPISTFVLS